MPFQHLTITTVHSLMDPDDFTVYTLMSLCKY